MRSFICVVVWTLLFVAFGLYVEHDLDTFISSYDDDINKIEKLIIDEKFDEAREEVLIVSEHFTEHKDKWYKLIDHTYYDDILFCLSVLESDANLDDRSLYLEYVNRIKSGFINMLKDERCDWNHIL